jgi:hypothetical protein
MKKNRKYTDEPGADKGAIHLIINKFRSSICPFCCNKQYDPDTIPVATVKELKAAHTVMLTGGEPFVVPGIIDFCSHLRFDYSNIKQIYVYTSGYIMSTHEELHNYPCRLYRNVDGINFSPKSKYDYEAIKNMLTNGDFAIEFFAHARSNRIILMPNDFMTRKQQEEFIESLPLEGLAFYGAKFDVEYREWQEEFQPNGGVWRRLPVFL